MAVILIIGAVFIFNKKIGEKDVAYKKEKNIPKKEYLIKDVDSDGLYDWEEILWETNPNNPDTDQDGTNDGDEVKQNRNPKIPGPDDIFSPDENSDASSTEENLNLTEKIGRDFLFNYFSVKKMENLTEDEKQELVESFISKLNPENLEKKYAESDLKIAGENSKENSKMYLNKIGAIFKSFNTIEEGELQILMKILSNENEELPNELKKIADNKKVYENASYEMLKTETPPKYTSIHLGILNSLNNTILAISKMELVYENPAEAIVGIKIYSNESDKMIRIFKNFKAEAEKDKITFSPDESGYALIKNYFAKIK